MADAQLLPDRILYGAAFYDEYRVNGDLERDLDLMAEASFSVIRVGESVWATWEPEPGVYNLDWLQPVLDGAHARRISVVLGTPTYAVPPWLRAMDPDLAGEVATGVRHPWGRRQEADITHPLFRQHAEGVIRAIVARYADHPAIIGYQVDNEPGPFLLHNQRVFDGFLRWLEGRYGDVETLNREWGLAFWSQRIRTWDELWRPDGNHSPQYQLEWRRYQAELVTDFIAWQARIVREYADPRQFVTTCISYERPAIDDQKLVQELDVTAGNPYYMMQEALHIGAEVPRTASWWTSGVWALYEQGDRMFSSAQAPFLVTETNAQSIGQSHWQHHTPYPGQIALAGLALVARGARMIEYWQWQTLHYGIETYWGGVLPHSGRPGRIYREIAELVTGCATSGDSSRGSRPTPMSHCSTRSTRNTASSSTHRLPTLRAARIARRTSGSSIATTARRSRRVSRVESCTPTSSGSATRRTSWPSSRPSSCRRSTSPTTACSTRSCGTRRRAGTSSWASARATATSSPGRDPNARPGVSPTLRASGTTSTRRSTLRSASTAPPSVAARLRVGPTRSSLTAPTLWRCTPQASTRADPR